MCLTLFRFGVQASAAMKNWHESYPRIEVTNYSTGHCRKITVIDVARTCFGRCLYFGLRNRGDLYVDGEMDIAMHCAGLGPQYI